jgi:hypothetical protein
MVAHLGRGDRLEAEVQRQRRHRQALERPQGQGDQLMELRRSCNRVRDPRRLDLVLAGQLAPVIAEGDGVYPDDGHVYQVARSIEGTQQVPGLVKVGPAHPVGV